MKLFTFLICLDPSVPKISIKPVSDSVILLSWEREIGETKKHGAATNYSLKIKNGNEESEMVTNEKRIKLSNLTMCSEYCFLLSSANKAGSSEYSKEICCLTLAPSKLYTF